MHTITIPMSTDAAESFQDNYILNSKPVVVSGLPPSMPAYEKWTWDFFKKIGVGIDIGLASDPVKRGIVTSHTTLADYVEEVEGNSTSLYMVGWPFEAQHPELNLDYDLPSFHPSDFIDELPKPLRFRRRWVFIGREGLLSDLHVDCFTTSGWLMVVHGQKTVRLLSPKHRERVSPQDSLFDDNLVSRLLSEGAEFHEFVLSPGKIGYIPSGWMHHVRNDTNTIMVTGNWASNTDVLRFYPNFRSLVGRDTERCDEIYAGYVASLSAPKLLSVETSQIIDEEIKRLGKHLQRVTETLNVLEKMQRSNK